MSTVYNNSLFGGSVFDMKGAFANPLRKNLFEVKNELVGYYDLRNVSISKNQYVDIQIVISDLNNSNIKELDQIEQWHQKVKKNLKEDHDMDESLEFTHISEYLNGFARMIFYQMKLYS